MKYCSIITISIILSLAFGGGWCFAQPAIVSYNCYDTGRDEAFHDIYAVSNGDYIMSGCTTNNWISYRGDNSQTRVWVVRVNDDGEAVWSEEYGEQNQTSIGWSIIETDQGNFLISTIRNGQFSALMVNDAGEMLWWRDYGSGECRSAIELKNGDFLLGGWINDVNGRYGYVVCIEGDGDAIWSENYSQNGREELYSMRETEAGVILCGYQNNIWTIKIDFGGELLWSQIYNAQTLATSLVSSPNGGFMVTGWGREDNERFPFILKINDGGDFLWMRGNDHNHRLSDAKGTCIEKYRDGERYIVAGYRLIDNSNAIPVATRYSADGSFVWQREYDFPGDEGFPGGRDQFNSVVVDRNNSPLFAGVINRNHAEDHAVNYDAILLRSMPEILGPEIFYWSPEDTILDVLTGDTVNFVVRARNQLGHELEYAWFFGDSLLSNDTTVSVIFDSSGVFDVQCRVTDADFTSAIAWHVSVLEWYISEHTPDTLDLTVRRGTDLDFSLDIAALEDGNFDYLWILTGRDHRESIIGDQASTNVHFDMTGEHHLEGRVSRGIENDQVRWNINVRSCVWWWWPHELELSVPVDTVIDFAVFPFNPESDSIECRWEFDGEPIEDAESEIDLNLYMTGEHVLTAYVTEGVESDNVSWSLNVQERVFVDGETDRPELASEPVLFPPAPNPFNSITKIEVYLPESHHISLWIYDLKGRVTEQIYAGIVSVGMHSYQWDASSYPTGMYYLKLQFKNNSQIKKLLLLR